MVRGYCHHCDGTGESPVGGPCPWCTKKQKPLEKEEHMERATEQPERKRSPAGAVPETDDAMEGGGPVDYCWRDTVRPAVKKFASGAVRGTDADGERYDLIPAIGMRRLAETCAEGVAKYGAGNWNKGIPIPDLLNHAIKHLYQYVSGDRSEDHLAHAMWNLAVACHFEELGLPGDKKDAEPRNLPVEHMRDFDRYIAVPVMAADGVNPIGSALYDRQRREIVRESTVFAVVIEGPLPGASALMDALHRVNMRADELNRGAQK